LGNSVSLPWVIYYEAFYLHVASTFSCILVICPELVFTNYLIPLYMFVRPSICMSKYLLGRRSIGLKNLLHEDASN